MTIYNVSIQVGLLEFLKLMIGILQYQPSSEKIFSLDVPSTQLNELVFIRNPIIFPKIYTEINLFKSQKKNQNQTLESNPLILQLHGLFYILQLHRLFYIWQLHRLFYILNMTSYKLSTLKCNQKISNWTGFRKLTSLKVSAPITVGNCRTFPAYTMMFNLKKILSWNRLTCIL